MELLNNYKNFEHFSILGSSSLIRLQFKIRFRVWNSSIKSSFRFNSNIANNTLSQEKNIQLWSKYNIKTKEYTPIKFKQIFVALSHPSILTDNYGKKNIVANILSSDDNILLDLSYTSSIISSENGWKTQYFKTIFGNHNDWERKKSFNINTNNQFLFISVTDDVMEKNSLDNNYIKYPYESDDKVFSWIANYNSKEYKSDNSNKFIVTTTTYNEFFYCRFYEKYVAYNRFIPYNTVFHFVNRSWQEIWTYFYLCGYNLTGGNSNIRHLQSKNNLILGKYFSVYPSFFVKQLHQLSCKMDNKKILDENKNIINWESNILKNCNYIIELFKDIDDQQARNEMINLEKRKNSDTETFTEYLSSKNILVDKYTEELETLIEHYIYEKDKDKENHNINYLNMLKGSITECWDLLRNSTDDYNLNNFVFSEYTTKREHLVNWSPLVFDKTHIIDIKKKYNDKKINNQKRYYSSLVSKNQKSIKQQIRTITNTQINVDNDKTNINTTLSSIKSTELINENSVQTTYSTTHTIYTEKPAADQENEEKNLILERNIMYHKIKEIVDNHSIGIIDKQIKIEKLVYARNLKLFHEKESEKLKKKELSIFVGISSKYKEVLIKAKNNIENSIKVLKKRQIHQEYFKNMNVEKKFYKKSQKIQHSICILKIYTEIDVDLTNLFLVKFLELINTTTTEGCYATNLCLSLGRNIIQLYFYMLYNEHRKSLYGIKFEDQEPGKYNEKYYLKDWKEQNEEFVKLFVSEPFLCALGQSVYTILSELNLIKEDITSSDQGYNINIYSPTDYWMTIFKDYKTRSSIHVPDKLPMLVEPKKYFRVNTDLGNNKELYGGYLYNGHLIEEEIIINNFRLNKNSIISDKNIIYDTINNMSSVGYKINKPVLDFILLHNDKFDLTLINKKHEHEDKWIENNKFNKNQTLNKTQMYNVESFVSKRYVQENIINIADTYETAEEFFMPVRIDNRGRIYCSTSYLNYQGTELAKALLLFSKGEKILKTDIESINYLKIFGANCFGNKLDKKSFNDRINWVDINEENIINLENGILINQSEYKLLFIAFCFEYKKYVLSRNDDKHYFVSHLPIQLDATCNGFQHISMLGMDQNIINNLNIKKSSKADAPEDFYSFIAILIKGKLGEIIKDTKISEKDRIRYKRLFDLDLHRSLIKKCVMTIPYNTTIIQGIKYIRESFEYDWNETQIKNNIANISDDNSENEETLIKSETQFNKHIKSQIKKQSLDFNSNKWFRHKDNPNLKLELDDFKLLFFILREVLYKAAPSLTNIINYLKDIANICVTANTYIPWVLPSGLIVNQSYVELTELRISAFNYSKYTLVLKKKNKDILDKKKNIRALMPNLIHSLDAASLSLLIDKYFNVYNNDTKNIFAIHDCFGTTCNNMKFIIESLKLIYISIYADKKYLKFLDENMVNHIINNIDETFDNKNKKFVTISKNRTKTKKKDIILNYPDINKVLINDFDIKKYIEESEYIIN